MPGVSPGGLEATRTATIKVSEDGNVTVAHIVVRAVATKRGKLGTPRAAPGAELVKRASGIDGAVSFKRDPRNAMRFHATVVLANPVGAKTPVPATIELGFVGAGSDRKLFTFVVEITQIESDITYKGEKPPPWATKHCDPPGAKGDAYFAGAAGIGASRFLDVGCDLLNDRNVEPAEIVAMGLQFVFLELEQPGQAAEYLVTFRMVNIVEPGFLYLIFPEDRTVTRLLFPPSSLAGIVEGKPNVVAILWRGIIPDLQGYRTAIVQLSLPLEPNDVVCADTDARGPYPYRYVG
ncbi:MAG TPA: hypothetical protein VFR32_05665 [Gaiellaceae bacterium]|nr:hypothetical protein [Gaiellaceae bacterium]